MISEYLPKNKKWLFINIFGIAIAFAAVLLISSYTIHELSFDNFHSKADDIFRIQYDKPKDGNNYLSAEIQSEDIFPLYETFPDIKSVLRIYEEDNVILKIGSDNYYPKNIYTTSSLFFDFFDFKLLSGSKTNLFNNTMEAVINETTAMAYFGSVDVIGKEFTLKDDIYRTEKNYTIKAVMKDMPINSHIQANILLSIPQKKDKTADIFSYTYLLLHPNTDKIALSESLNKHAIEFCKEGALPSSFQLIPLRDIHLKSHTFRELSKAGDLSSIIILISGATIILLISLINYTNLNFVQFLSELKDLKIRIVNGASMLDLFNISVLRSIIQTSIALILGLILASTFSQFTQFSNIFKFSVFNTAILSLLFLCLFALMAIIPLYTKRVDGNLSQKIEQGSKKFVVSLVIQFALSIVAVILTIVFQQQTSLIGKLHPGKDKENIVCISNVPYPSIAKYEIFKEQSMQHSEIELISGSTVQPGVIAPLNYPFEMEGYDNDEKQRITILSIDEDFFTLFKIKPIAGSLKMSNTSSIEWEQIAIKINPYSNKNEANLKRLEEYEKSHPGFKEQYILNRAALNLLGIKSPKNAIGKSFKLNFDAPHLFPKGEITAVIQELHYGDLFKKEEPMVLVSKKLFNSTFYARVNPINKQKAIKSLQEEWRKVNPDYPLQYQFLDKVYAEIYQVQFSEMKALGLFAILSILLSTLGMFALSAYSIQHKTKEIGIKKANGASSVEIMVELIAEYLKWVLLAFIIACPIAYYIARDWLNKFAYKIEPNWWIFALAGLTAIIIAITTVSWQTWNAARKDPVYALRYE